MVPDDVRDLWVIRVDNWFDHKWLRFSGKGRVPFDHPHPSNPGVALDEFSQDKLTFPPFSPRRILTQEIWTFAESQGRKRRLVHPRVLQHSAANLHRRVSDFSDSMVAIWFSARTEENRQGCVMQYTSRNGRLDAWYMSLCLDTSSWRLIRTKGLERQRADVFVADDDPPSSAVTQRQ